MQSFLIKNNISNNVILLFKNRMHHKEWKCLNNNNDFILIKNECFIDFNNMQMNKKIEFDKDLINKVHIRIKNSTERIAAEYPYDYDEIIISLNDLLKELENPTNVDLNWNLGIYNINKLSSNDNAN